MDRAQFMQQLSSLLDDISEAERREALDYYENYFDDAGEEQSADVIRELGSPEKVAAIIKADLKESNDTYAQYTEWGYEDTRTREPGQMPDKYTAIARTGYTAKKENRTDRAAYHQSYEETGRDINERRFGRGRANERHDRNGRRAEQAYQSEEAHKGKGANAGILILIFLVFAAPVITGAVGGMLGVMITILFLPFLLVFAFGSAALGILAGAAGTLISGIGLCFSSPAEGILTIGVGCLLAALGFLFCIVTAWFACRILPKIFYKIRDFIGKIIHRGRRNGEEI